jgi:pyruvate dehydrogenase E1 component alpha subunit
MGKDDLLRAYHDMLLIRRFEEKAGQLYGMGLIGGFCHLYIGQEAVVVGVQAALKPGDEVITSYRDHGHMLATGMEARGVMAELTGRATGYSHGKGGSMHMFSKAKGFYGGHGIVGAQVSIGAGLGFANWYRGNDNVSVTYFGEGASNQGQVFESFNLAALMKLPVVFIIENNRYGMGTSVERASASKDLSKNGAPWGLGLAGGRHERRRREGSGRAGDRPLPCRKRAVPAGDEDIPLSRPLHVRPRQVPHARRGAEDAQRAGLHRERPSPPHRAGRG